MKPSPSTAIAAALCAGAIVLPGCIVVAEHDPALPLGAFTVEWSIDGRTDPVECYLMDADRLELVVFDRWGNLIAEADPSCDDFVASVELPEGLYEARVTLTDTLDRSATLTAELDEVEVISETELIVGIDFPVDSFL